jgi:hypothetical protein
MVAWSSCEEENKTPVFDPDGKPDNVALALLPLGDKDVVACLETSG